MFHLWLKNEPNWFHFKPNLVNFEPNVFKYFTKFRFVGLMTRLFTGRLQIQ